MAAKKCIVMIEGYKRDNVMYAGNKVFEIGTNPKTQISPALVKELKEMDPPKCRDASAEEVKTMSVSYPNNYREGGPLGHKNNPKPAPKPEAESPKPEEGKGDK